MRLPATRTIPLLDLELGGNRPFFLIAGPCVVEGRQFCLDLAGRIREVTEKLEIPFIFKASYDKANRSSIRSFRGPGLQEGLEILAEVRRSCAVPVLSDVHDAAQAELAAEVLDVLQIPAFLCRQTDLLLAAARSGKALNVKKGQFLAPWDVRNVVEKIESAGGRRLLLTERGASYGYNNLVVDFRSLPILRSFGYPVVFDATHSVQLPGGSGTHSSGQAEFIPHLARAAAAVGVDGLFVEVHPQPERALSDGPNALKLSLLEAFLQECREIDLIAKRGAEAAPWPEVE